MASSNCEAPSPCALASAADDSAIKFTSAPCSVLFALGNFSTLQIRAACLACAHSSSIGFRRVRVYRQVVEPVILCSTPKQTPGPRSARRQLSAPQAHFPLCTSPQTLSHHAYALSISSSFRASSRNTKRRVKTKLAAWCSPSARQKARTSCRSLSSSMPNS